MIFLGAGASKTFGIKTLQEMSEDLIQMMETKGYADTVERILSALNRFSLTPDFEAIYTIVKGLVNASQTVKESGPFTAFVCKELHDIEPRQNFEELLKDFNGFLYEECRLKPKFIDKISMTYDKLFTILKDSGAKDTRCLARASQLKQAGIGCEFPVGTDDTIITTNYDMIIETYQRIRKEKYADGFRPVDGDPTRKELDLATYSFERQKWLIKLHGSIYEYRENNEIFKSVEDPEKSEIPPKIQEKMIIYPADEKPILRSPYYGFYDTFRLQRWNKLTAIGYSFRDKPVNIAILDNLAQIAHSILIVVNPGPEEVIQNLGDLAQQRIDERVIPVKGYFGDEKVFQQLETALKVESKRRFYKRVVEIEGIENYWKSIGEKKYRESCLPSDFA